MPVSADRDAEPREPCVGGAGAPSGLIELFSSLSPP